MSVFSAGWIEGAGGTARLRAGMMRFLEEVGIDFRDDEACAWNRSCAGMMGAT